jgi:hypothetical protein
MIIPLVVELVSLLLKDGWLALASQNCSLPLISPWLHPYTSQTGYVSALHGPRTKRRRMILACKIIGGNKLPAVGDEEG